MAPQTPKLPDNVKELVFRMSGFQDEERRKAVDKLHAYYQQEKALPFSVTNHKALTVIWKGLHTAMLRQDQPLLQETVANKISSIIHCFRKEKTANLFVKVALETFSREWDRVNQFMVDKMMMLMRRVIREALFRLADQDWRHVEQFVSMLEETAVLPLDHSHTFCRGTKLHLSSLYLEELSKANNETLTHSTIMLFLRPYIKVIALSRCQWYVKDVITNVFHHLIRQSDVGIDSKSYLLEGETLARSTDYGFDDRDVPEDGNDAESDEDDNEENDSDEEDDEEIEGEDEELEGEDQELEGESEESDEGIEDEDTEEDEEDLPLDPRGGNVDVLLPQLQLNYDELSEALQEMMSSEGMYKKNRSKIMTLVKQVNDVVGGVFPLELFPKDFDKEVMEAPVAELDVDRAVGRALSLRRREFSAAYKSHGNTASKRQLESDRRRAAKVGKNVHRHWSRLNAIQRQRFRAINDKSNTKRFMKYARNTDKIAAKLDMRRAAAKNKRPLPDAESNPESKRAKLEKALLKKATRVTGGLEDH